MSAAADRLGDGRGPSSREMSSQAGMSKHQHKQAVRVANVPEDQFENAVESEAPATVTKLAEMGKQSLPPRPEGFKEATALFGTVWRFAEFCEANDPEAVATGVLPHEIQKARECITVIDGWMDCFVVHLGAEHGYE